MAVIKRGKTWSVIIYVTDPVTGQRKQKWFGGYETKTKAKQAEAELIVKQNKGLYIEPTKATLAEYLYKWFDIHKKNLSPTTSRRYEGVIKNHLVPCLGNIQLSKLLPLHIQGFVNHELQEGRKDNKKTVTKSLSSASVNYEIQVLSKALNQAVEWQIISKNPAKLIKVPKTQKKPIKLLDEKQINCLLNFLSESYLYLPTYLAIYTGMRLGEILGLRWQDISFKNKMIHVKQSNCQMKHDKPQFKNPKSGKFRAINISDSVVKVLKREKKRQGKKKLALGGRWENYDLICCRKDGKPHLPSSFSSHFRNKVKECGLDITFHGLRHTHASLLLKAGIPAKVVSERLGHSTISITMDIYSHVMPGMQEEAAAKLDELIANIN